MKLILASKLANDLLKNIFINLNIELTSLKYLDVSLKMFSYIKYLYHFLSL